MTALETRFVGPTATKGSRISVKALGSGQRALVTYPAEMNDVQAHEHAVVTLCRRMGWCTALAPGSAARKYWEAGDTKHGYVWVLVCE